MDVSQPTISRLITSALAGFGGMPQVSGVWDRIAAISAVHDAAIDGLPQTAQIAQARSAIERVLVNIESWAWNHPELWMAQKRLARIEVLLAGLLDPAVPADALRRKELLDRAAATLAPEKIVSRLTVDVQEMLAEIERRRTEAQRTE